MFLPINNKCDLITLIINQCTVCMLSILSLICIFLQSSADRFINNRYFSMRVKVSSVFLCKGKTSVSICMRHQKLFKMNADASSL